MRSFVRMFAIAALVLFVRVPYAIVQRYTLGRNATRRNARAICAWYLFARHRADTSRREWIGFTPVELRNIIRAPLVFGVRVPLLLPFWILSQAHRWLMPVGHALADRLPALEEEPHE